MSAVWKLYTSLNFDPVRPRKRRSLLTERHIATSVSLISNVTFMLLILATVTHLPHRCQVAELTFTVTPVDRVVSSTLLRAASKFALAMS